MKPSDIDRALALAEGEPGITRLLAEMLAEATGRGAKVRTIKWITGAQPLERRPLKNVGAGNGRARW